MGIVPHRVGAPSNKAVRTDKYGTCCRQTVSWLKTPFRVTKIGADAVAIEVEIGDFLRHRAPRGAPHLPLRPGKQDE